MAKKRISAKWWLKRLAIAALTICIVIYGLPRIVLLKQEIEAHQENIPTESEQLHDMIKVKDGQNAAPLYQEASAQLDQVVRKEGKFVLDGITAVKAGDTSAVKQCWSSMAPFMPGIKVAEQASNEPGLDFGRNWQQGYNLEMPEMEKMHFMVLLECAMAQLYADANDSQNAKLHLGIAERITAQIGSEPDLVSALVYIKSQSDIDRMVMRMVENGSRNRTTLAGIDETLSNVPPPRSLSFYAKGELVMNLATIRKLPTMTDEEYDDLLAGISRPADRESAKKMLKVGLMNPFFQADYIGYYRQVINSMPKDSNDWQVLKRAGMEADRLSSQATLTSICTSLLAKPLFSVCAAMSKSIARTRLADTAVKLVMAESQNGKLPATLPSFGDLSVDPFSGAQFVYEPQGNGFRLFSVGQNGSANGKEHMENLIVLVPSTEHAA